jgi:ABC-type multidrug transport system fused ATPase/permease subunit
VARLLLRFYDPTGGQVFLGGVPLDRLDRHTLYETMSYVPQDSFLFDATLRENLTIGRAEATDEELQDVIHRACLEEYVARLPHGLDTKVGERGLSLSGGERQRVAIARALLRHPRVMVLDEATSAMDVELEEEILKELVGVRGMTVVAITHRPRMAQVADRVLRLDRGRVQREGGPVGV